MSAHISTNDGRTFVPMFIKTPRKGSLSNFIQFELNIPCVLKVDELFPKEWISIFEASVYDTDYTYHAYIVSYDGGRIWLNTPFPNFSPLVLNNGGLLFGINARTNEIVYSFDEGNVYYRKNVFKEHEFILNVVPNGFCQKEYIIIVGTSMSLDTWIFTHLNFSNIFSKFDFLSQV
ncbi:hypothetical protein RF11_04107 [Thelohanellus kitauei]|uniref:Sortilin N-terminal domain-containing protein n=1 Tax=Thelohanellus kitauei TaxID=669202 RepID=A0A0C2IK99_THEKT|nr:hypothetical protein RF11_04107 [Thelohanellus kitauei]